MGCGGRREGDSGGGLAEEGYGAFVVVEAGLGVADFDDVDVGALGHGVAVGGAVPGVVDVTAVVDLSAGSGIDVDLIAEDGVGVVGGDFEMTDVFADGVVGAEGVGYPEDEGVGGGGFVGGGGGGIVGGGGGGAGGGGGIGCEGGIGGCWGLVGEGYWGWGL